MDFDNEEIPQGAQELFLLPWEDSAIILVDLDAFFAAVEQLDHPGWRGKPVIVGGAADKRGVVATASYEARVYGVRSAMPSSIAHRLCPDAIWTSGNHARYREISQEVMNILACESPLIQQVSIDEAFVDISPTAYNSEHPVLVAQRIQKKIEELGVSASIGLGISKTIAKIASDRDKPRGLTIVYPGREKDFLKDLPIKTLSGIGTSTEKELHRHGIETLGDLATTEVAFLERLLGKNGRLMHLRAQGRDDSPVEMEDETKSISNEITFSKDLRTQKEINTALASIAAKVGRRLRMKGLKGHTLGLKIRYDDRSVRTVQKSLDENIDDDFIFTPLLKDMLKQVWRPGTPVRLLGVFMTGFKEQRTAQTSLFDEAEFEMTKSLDDQQSTKGKLSHDNAQKRFALLKATDKVRDRFGESAVQFGHEIETQKRTTGSSPKNPADYQ